MICPCISSKSEYATCSKSEEGMMTPSIYARENYCFGIYELCPVFSMPAQNTASCDSLGSNQIRKGVKNPCSAMNF